MDLPELKCKTYLVVYATKFFYIRSLPNLLPLSLIQTKLSIFGIHNKVISDNGKDYKLFAKQWHLKHDPSGPHYPKSNVQI